MGEINKNLFSYNLFMAELIALYYHKKRETKAFQVESRKVIAKGSIKDAIQYLLKQYGSNKSYPDEVLVLYKDKVYSCTRNLENTYDKKECNDHRFAFLFTRNVLQLEQILEYEYFI